MPFQFYSCGSNGKRQLGNGTEEDSETLRRVLETKVACRKIACGGNHTLILMENGELYATGDNTQGQCGVNATDNNGKLYISHFMKVAERNGARWVDCSCGYEYSILLNEHQELYSCGLGPKGELGLGTGIVSSSTLAKIGFAADLGKITDVRSCLDHNVLKTEEGILYGWGNGRNGKLGEPAASKIWLPRMIVQNFIVKDIELGRDFTVAGDGKQVSILGNDKYGMSAHLNTKYQVFKTMWSSIHFVDLSGKILSFGNDSHGQLIPDSEVDYDLFAVGSEHGIISTNDKITTWGWGEHGNCGVKRNGSNTFNYFNELDYDETNKNEVVMVQGGCATTWVVTKT